VSVAVQREELERRRERVARDLAEEHWDLGGLAYEMAIRDHFRLDVLSRKAARVQELDAQLAALERLIKMESEGAAGSCSSCGALYARGAAFCWRCGTELARTLPAS
jgi:predicted RNase H-like nuclease (RuvC/YqgF family)